MAMIPDIESKTEDGRFKLEQVAIRMIKERPLYSETPIHSPKDVIRVMADTLLDYDREVFAVVNFQTDMRPINFSIISMGCLNSSLVHPREVIKASILSNASGVILFHNHPSGTVEPSKDDIITTDQLKNAFNLMGIRVLDHIIVGNDKSYYSLSEKDKLALPKRNYAKTLDKLDLKHQKVATPEKNSVAANLKGPENRQTAVNERKVFSCEKSMTEEKTIRSDDTPDFVREAEELLIGGEKPNTRLNEVIVKFGKALVGKPFVSKSGKELVKVSIPNSDRNDHRPRESFLISSKKIHDNKHGKGVWMKLPKNGTTRLSRPVKTGVDKSDLTIRGRETREVSNTMLKSLLESYKDKNRNSVLSDLSDCKDSIVTEKPYGKNTKKQEAAR